MLLTSCRKVELLTSLFSYFPKPCKINKLQTKKDSIPIAVRSGPAISPHPPQPPAATFKRLNRTRAEHRASVRSFVRTHVRLSTSVYRDLTTERRNRGTCW